MFDTIKNSVDIINKSNTNCYFQIVFPIFYTYSNKLLHVSAKNRNRHDSKWQPYI